MENNLILPFILTALALAALFATPGIALADSAKPKDATEVTKKANTAMLEKLPFGNKEDFELATRGLIAEPESLVIKNKSGQTVWDMDMYRFQKPEAKSPDTVNPSLWRQSQLNAIYGLFKVTDRIFQVRGYDLSNITYIKGDIGWIVFDPLISEETANAAHKLVEKNLGKRPVVAVVYSHSHVDHFGGVKGIVSEDEVKAGKVRILAPKGFLHHAVSENVLAGNAMSRRAMYQGGLTVPPGPKGQVDVGLGKAASTGEVTLIPPTDIIGKTPTEITIDGVTMVFQYTPGTEAPAEMNTYFPQFKALWMAENCTDVMHNIYTIRGAEIRDSYAWAHFINQAIDLFGDRTEVVFASHHWPRWGKEKALAFLGKQRDLYKYIHDQTLRLANQGYTMVEIAEMMKLPKSLGDEFFNRGYYGTLNHNVKGVYQKYLGWYDANPAHLHELPPVEAGKKYVEYLGGADAVIEKARKDFEKGEYRWVAQVMNHVVFADPGNRQARELAADALEQLGYQAEAGTWRNAYLLGAKELRDGVTRGAVMKSSSRDVIRAMTPELFFDYLAVRLNGPKAEGKKIGLNIVFTDSNKEYALTLDNSVLNYLADRQLKKADATITLTRPALNDLILGQASLDELNESGRVKVSGERKKIPELLSMLDNFDFFFNVVTP